MKRSYENHYSFLSKSTDQPSDSVKPLNPMEGNLLDWAMTQLQSRMPMRPRNHILPASGFPFFWRWRYGLGDGFNGFHISFQLKRNNMNNHRKFVFVETNRISWWWNKDRTAKKTRGQATPRGHAVITASKRLRCFLLRNLWHPLSMSCLSFGHIS